MAIRRAVSVPGLMGSHCAARAFAELEYLGSTQMILVPDFLA
jgi:hypothetical protein